jgi:hypothetical protein
MAQCPICTEFEGSVSSVEAHISGKSDDLHRGEVGWKHRDALLEDDQEGDADEGSEAVDDAEVEAELAEVVDEAEEELPEWGEADEERSEPEVERSDPEPVEVHEDGINGTALVMASVAVVGAVILASASGTSNDEAAQTADSEAQQGMSQEPALEGRFR